VSIESKTTFHTAPTESLTIDQTSSTNTVKAVGAKDREYPTIPAQALNKLANAVNASHDVGHDWTNDAFIGAQAERCFNLSPQLGEYINDKTGLQLTASRNNTLTSLVAMTGKADFTEFESTTLLKELTACLMDGLDKIGVDEPFAVGEEDTINTLEKKFNETITGCRADINNAAVKTQSDLEVSIDDIEMLEEFRKLKGRNDEHLVVDREILKVCKEELFGLAEKEGVTQKAAFLVMTLCENVVEMELPKGSYYKMAINEAIDRLSGLADALVYVDSVLAESDDFFNKGQDSENSSLSDNLRTAEEGLKSALTKIKDTPKALNNVSDHKWKQDFQFKTCGNNYNLEYRLKPVKEVLEEKIKRLATDLSGEKARLGKHALALSTLENNTKSPQIKSAATALANVVKLAQQAVATLFSNPEQIACLKATISALNELCNKLSEVDVAYQLRHSGESGQDANVKADQLQRLSDKLYKTASQLKGAVQPMNIYSDPKPKEVLSADVLVLSDLHQATNKALDKLGTVHDRLIDIKRNYRTQKTQVEIAGKKLSAVSKFTVGTAKSAFKAIVHPSRQGVRATEAGSRHLLDQIKAKLPHQNTRETQMFNALLRASTLEPLNAMQKFCNQAEGMMSSAADVAKTNGKIARDPKEGALSRAKKQDITNTTATERLSKKRADLKQPQKELSAALLNLKNAVKHAKEDLALMEKRFPKRFDKIQAFKTRLEKAEATFQKIEDKFNVNVKPLKAEQNSFIPPSFRGTFERMRSAMVRAETFTTSAVKCWREMPEAAQESLHAAGKALDHSTGPLITQAANILKNDNPSPHDVQSALEEVIESLKTSDRLSPALNGVAGFKEMTEARDKTRNELKDIKSLIPNWISALDAAPLANPTHALSSSEIGAVTTAMNDQLRNAQNTQRDLELSVARTTNRRQDIFSVNSRIIKHIASTFAAQTTAIAGEFSPEQREIHDQHIGMSIKECSEYFRKPGDANGEAFSLRLAKEYEQALNGTLTMPKSLNEVMKAHQSFEEYLVKSGSKNLQSSAIYMMASNAINEVLLEVIPPFSTARGVRNLVKTLLTPLTIAMAIGDMKHSVMPGYALPAGAKTEMAKEKIKIAAFKFVRAFTPVLLKLAVDATLTGVEVNRDGLKAVLSKNAKSLPEDLLFAGVSESLSYGANSVAKLSAITPRSVLDKIMESLPDSHLSTLSAKNLYACLSTIADLLTDKPVSSPTEETQSNPAVKTPHQKQDSTVAGANAAGNKAPLTDKPVSSPTEKTQSKPAVKTPPKETAAPYFFDDEGYQGDAPVDESAPVSKQNAPGLEPEPQLAPSSKPDEVSNVRNSSPTYEAMREALAETLRKNRLGEFAVLNNVDGWLKKHIKTQLSEKGFTGPIHWDAKVDVYRPAQQDLRGRPVPRVLLGNTSLYEVALKLHERKWTDTSYEFEFEEPLRHPDTDGINLLTEITQIDAQPAYMQEFDRISQDPEFRANYRKYKSSLLHLTVENHFSNSAEPTTFTKEEVLEKIKSGNVDNLRFYGENVKDMVRITGENGNVLYISLATGEVFEAKNSLLPCGIKFRNEKEGQAFVNLIKRGLKIEHQIDVRNFESTRINFPRTTPYNFFESDHNGLVITEPNEESLRAPYPLPFSKSVGKTYRLGTEIIEQYRPEKDIISELAVTDLDYARADVDFLIKSDGEILLDQAVKIIGTAGTMIGVFLLPITGGLSALGSATAGVAIASSSAGSAALTFATGVLPKFVQSYYADNRVDSESAMLDAFSSMAGEAGGYIGGKYFGKFVKTLRGLNADDAIRTLQKSEFGNFLDGYARRKGIAVNDLSNDELLKLKDFYNANRGGSTTPIDQESSSNSLDSTSSTPSTRDTGSNGQTTPKDIDIQRNNSDNSLASNRTSKSSSEDSGLGSNSKSTTDSVHNNSIERMDIPNSGRVPKKPCDLEDINSTVQNDFAQRMNNFAAHYTLQNIKYENQLATRTLANELRIKGYSVEVGNVTYTGPDGIAKRNVILKVSKAGYEDAYVSFNKSTPRKPNSLTIYYPTEFKKSYIWDQNLSNSYTHVHWADNFRIMDKTFPLDQGDNAINIPGWFKNKQLDSSIETLTRNSSSTDSGINSLPNDSTQNINAKENKQLIPQINFKEQIPLIAASMTINYQSVTLAGELVNSLKDEPLNESAPAAPHVPFAPSAPTLKNAPPNVLLVSTIIDSVEQDGKSNNVRMVGSNSNPNRPTTVQHYSNTNVQEAINGAQEASQKSETSTTPSQLGTDVDRSKLIIPIVLLVDPSKIPGYTAGQPLPIIIPNDAIVGIYIQDNNVDPADVENVMEKLIGRRVPVTVAGIIDKVKETEATKDFTDIKQVNDWMAKNRAPVTNGSPEWLPPNILKIIKNATALQLHIDLANTPLGNSLILSEKFLKLTENLPDTRDYINDHCIISNPVSHEIKFSKSKLTRLSLVIQAEGVDDKHKIREYIKNVISTMNDSYKYVLPPKILLLTKQLGVDVDTFATKNGYINFKEPGVKSYDREGMMKLQQLLWTTPET